MAFFTGDITDSFNEKHALITGNQSQLFEIKTIDP